MAEANQNMVKDANEAEEAKAEPRPGDDQAYEDSWYQVLKARRTAAENAKGDAAEEAPEAAEA
jgi:hypothetical protein